MSQEKDEQVNKQLHRSRKVSLIRCHCTCEIKIKLSNAKYQNHLHYMRLKVTLKVSLKEDFQIDNE